MTPAGPLPLSRDTLSVPRLLLKGASPDQIAHVSLEASHPSAGFSATAACVGLHLSLKHAALFTVGLQFLSSSVFLDCEGGGANAA